MEVVYRALFIFAFLWFITRVTGRATLGELSTFQLLLYVTMGDLVQQAVTQQDYSVTASVLAIGVFALLTALLSWLNTRYRRLRPLTHGTPVIVVDQGEPVIAVRARLDGRPDGRRPQRGHRTVLPNPARGPGNQRPDFVLHR